MASKEKAVGQLEEWVPPDFGRKRPRRRSSVTRKSPSAVPEPVARRAAAGNGAARNGSAGNGAADARDWVAVTADPNRLEGERKEAEEKTRAAEERARLAEREVERLRRQLAARPARRPGHKRTPSSPSTAKSKEADDSGPIDLNTASFEALRALGLSITQSARVISQREQMRGFRSLEDIDSLFGLPRATKAFLRETCRV